MSRRTTRHWLTLLWCLPLFLAGGSLRAAPWERAVESGGLAYFFIPSPAQVERYDLAARKWLDPISFPPERREMTAGAVDADGLYMAYHDSVFRYDLNGGHELLMLNIIGDVRDLLSDGPRLIVNHSRFSKGRYSFLDKATNTTIVTTDNGEGLASGSVYVPALRRLLGPMSYAYFNQFSYVQFLPNGEAVNNGPKIVTDKDGSQHPPARCWLFPGGARVLDSNGAIYSTGMPAFVGNLDGPVNDVIFIKGVLPVVLRDGELHAYFPSLAPAGQCSLPAKAQSIFQNGADILAFTPDDPADHGIRVDTVPLTAIKAPAGTVLNSNALCYAPNDVFVSRDGLVYLHSALAQSLFRWDPAKMDYLKRIPLASVPDFIAYSDANYAFYLAQDSGEVRRISLGDPKFAETPLFKLNQKAQGLAAAGRYLLALDDNPGPAEGNPPKAGATKRWFITPRTAPDSPGTPVKPPDPVAPVSDQVKPLGPIGAVFKVFSGSGELLSTAERRHQIEAFAWSEPARRMFYLTKGVSPIDLWSSSISTAGQLSEKEQDSPLHADDGFLPPLFVAPSGKEVLVGSGLLHDSASLARKPSALPNAIDDAIWLPDGLYTVNTGPRDLRPRNPPEKKVNPQVQLQKWKGSPLSLIHI